MLRPRLIVSLLLQNNRLVKTIKFEKPRYIGDPLNTVRIFNEKFCDELVLFDIEASKSHQNINFELLSKIASVSNMPLCYGGGITEVDDAKKMIHLGFEKISLSSAFFKDPSIVYETAKMLGSQSVVVTLDIQKTKGIFGQKFSVKKPKADTNFGNDPLEIAYKARELGAGEIIFNSVYSDGTQNGYDLDFAAEISDKLDVPVTFLGGCGTLEDMTKLLNTYGHCGCAAASTFIYKGKLNGVLINYPIGANKNLVTRGMKNV